MGRHKKYETVEAIEAAIEEYFTPGPRVKTVTGLALHLGFTSRQAILNYEDDPKFIDAIKTAKLRVENQYEEALFSKNPAGAIFALKNFGWSDKQETETKLSGGIDVTWSEPKKV